MGSWPRVLAGSIMILVLAVAIVLPNGYTCREVDAVEVHRQWSFGQERWFYLCFPNREMIGNEAGSFPFRPMDAATEWRIPFRIGVVIAGLVLAWAVVVLIGRRGLVGGATIGTKEPWTTNRRTRILVAIYALFGAAIAVLVTLHQDEYWVRGTDWPFATRSFLGWDMTPVLAEALFAVVGATGGIALGILVSNVHRRFESSRAMVGAREATSFSAIRDP